MATKNVSRKNNGSILWMDLQVVLSKTEDLKELKTLLDNERKGANRSSWVLRIHQRYNRVRRENEQRELLRQVR